MAKMLNNLYKNQLITKREKVLAKIDFNEKYLVVSDEIFSEKIEKKMKKATIESKKRLYPLELRKTTSFEKNTQIKNSKIEELIKKQELPRRAIEQKYLRLLAKSGEEAAKAYKAQSLSKLDSKLNDLKASLDNKYNTNTKDKASDADIKAYEEAFAKEEKALKDLKNSFESDKQAKLKALNEKVVNQNKTLQAKSDSLAKKLEKFKDKDDLLLEEDVILDVENLLMQFGGLKAVDNLSFKVKKGEIFGLIGPNGAGKTTVFNCITQFYKPTAGKVTYRDKNGEIIDLTKKKVHDVIKTGIVRTFQNVELIWELSVLDNLLVAGHTLYQANLFEQIIHSKKLKREEQVVKAKALQVLERLDLLSYKDSIPFGLPYGILKKIELARTLMVNPRLIILDEPAAGLNDAETEELSKTIKQIGKDFDCTIFLVEHDMGLVMDICDTICSISFGKMLAIGTPAEIQDNKLVQEAYLGSE